METDLFLQHENYYISFPTLHCQVRTYAVISKPCYVQWLILMP